jgi:hypothetical protein
MTRPGPIVELAAITGVKITTIVLLNAVGIASAFEKDVGYGNGEYRVIGKEAPRIEQQELLGFDAVSFID